jgi:inorganic pyrophosphatase
LKFNPKLGAFMFVRPLLAGLAYPYDWGFIPSTKAQDGDPLDAMIMHDAPTYPGVVLRCKPLGVLDVMQTRSGINERNDRIFLLPDRSPLETDLRDVTQLSQRAREGLERFFEASNAFETKTLEFLGWHGPAQAITAIQKAFL